MANIPETLQTLPISPKFNDPLADITFQSSDSVLFRVQRQNIRMYAEAFSDAEVVTANGKARAKADTETVPLTEKANVLELLFQFMRLQQPPQLDKLSITRLFELAEAAEKYVVHGASMQCRSQLRLWALGQDAFVREHLSKTLRFADEHQFPELLNDVAPKAIDMPIADVAAVLSPLSFKAWVLYQNQWTNVSSRIRGRLRPFHDSEDGFVPCEHGSWPKVVSRLQYHLGSLEWSSFLTQPDKLFKYVLVAPWDDDEMDAYDDTMDEIAILGDNVCCVNDMEWCRQRAVEWVEEVKPLRAFLEKAL